MTYSGLTLAEWEEDPRQNPFLNDAFDGAPSWRLGAPYLGARQRERPHHAALRLSLQPRLVAPVEQLRPAAQRPPRPRLRRHGEPAHPLRERGTPAGLRSLRDRAAPAHGAPALRPAQRGRDRRPRPLRSPGAASGERGHAARARGPARRGQPAREPRHLGLRPGPPPARRLHGERRRAPRSDRIRAHQPPRQRRGRRERRELPHAVGARGGPDLGPGLRGQRVRGNSPRLRAPSHRGRDLPDRGCRRSRGGEELELRARPARAARARPADRCHPLPQRLREPDRARLARGGLGATLTNGGQTLHEGLEAGVRIDSGTITGSRHNFFLRGAFTWLPVARFEGARFSSVPGPGRASASPATESPTPRNRS